MYKGLDPTRRVNVLGTGISEVNMECVIEYLFETLRQKESGYVCVTGAHGVMESLKDSELKMIHNQSLLTVPDGVPNVWLGRLAGVREMGRVYGPDMMLEVFERSQQEKKTHFLFGATDETINKLVANLNEKYPEAEIVGTYAPPFRPLTDDEEIALQQQVEKCHPDFLWVGLSTPKQERFMYSHSPSGRFPLKVSIMLGVGAAFDFHAGNIVDAPQWIKNLGLQWFYRLCSEPKRLWKRYSFIVPGFIWLNILQALGIKKYTLED